MANKYFVTTPGAADPALKAQQEAARAAARLQRTGGVGRITSEAQLRDAQNQWIQAGKPSSGPLYAELMRVSLQRNRAIKEGRPDPITGQRNTKNVFKLPVDNNPAAPTPAQTNPFAVQQQEAAQAAARRRAQPSTIAPAISQADINAASSSIQNSGLTTAVDAAPVASQTQAGTNGVMGQATPFADTRQRQQNRNTQFRSQRSGFSGNRRFHPFAGRGA